MTRAKSAPAAGASGGRAPLPSVYHAPRFINREMGELHVLHNNLRDPLCTHLLNIIESYCIHQTGEFLGSYAGLIDLSTPPKPERGPRRKGPTMWEVRRAIADLEAAGLLRRGKTNLEHGQLRLWVTKMAQKPAPSVKLVR